MKKTGMIKLQAQQQSNGEDLAAIKNTQEQKEITSNRKLLAVSYIIGLRAT